MIVCESKSKGRPSVSSRIRIISIGHRKIRSNFGRLRLQFARNMNNLLHPEASLAYSVAKCFKNLIAAKE
jgi:hypothetical protein